MLGERGNKPSGIVFLSSRKLVNKTSTPSISTISNFSFLALHNILISPLFNHQRNVFSQFLLTYVGRDSFCRPVYEADGHYYVDVDPRRDMKPNICTKYRDEFDGEPCDPGCHTIPIFATFHS